VVWQLYSINEYDDDDDNDDSRSTDRSIDLFFSFILSFIRSLCGCCTERHSDGAVNSYVTGTEMKDTFRPDSIDSRGIPCCRPESRYHPHRLQVPELYTLSLSLSLLLSSIISMMLLSYLCFSAAALISYFCISVGLYFIIVTLVVVPCILQKWNENEMKV